MSMLHPSRNLAQTAKKMCCVVWGNTSNSNNNKDITITMIMTWAVQFLPITPNIHTMWVQWWQGAPPVKCQCVPYPLTVTIMAIIITILVKAFIQWLSNEVSITEFLTSFLHTIINKCSWCPVLCPQTLVIIIPIIMLPQALPHPSLVKALGLYEYQAFEMGMTHPVVPLEEGRIQKVIMKARYHKFCVSR